MKKYLIFIVVVLAVLFFSGCCNPISPILKLLFEEQQGNLRVLYGRNATDYIYDKGFYQYLKDNYPPYYLEYYFPDGDPLEPFLHTPQAEAVHLQPGDIVNYEINIKSNSGHQYKYKDVSVPYGKYGTRTAVLIPC